MGNLDDIISDEEWDEYFEMMDKLNTSSYSPNSVANQRFAKSSNLKINHDKITEFSVTKSGDIWIEVDEKIFNEIQYDDWERVVLSPNSDSLQKLLPNWRSKSFQEKYAYEIDEEYGDDPLWFGWLKRVVIRCLEKTRPIDTLHQIYLCILDMEFGYTGDFYWERDERINCVEIGDDGWENYYNVIIHTSPEREPSPWYIND